MAARKYGVLKSDNPKTTRMGKYFVYRCYDNPFHPTNPDDPKVWSLYLDDRCIEGGFYFSGGMVRGAMPPEMAADQIPQMHDHVEYLAFLGTNPDDETDLGAKVEFFLDGESHTITKTCVVMIPANTWHCPVIIKRVDRPFLFYSASDAPRLYEYRKRNPNGPNPKMPMVKYVD